MPQANSADNPLSAGSLATFMAASLPKAPGQQVKNAYEAVALAVHAGMIAVGFRLVGLGEDHRIEAHADAHDPQPLPTEWNDSSSYAFRYKHAQSSMEYLVKVNRLGGKAVVLAMALGDDKATNFDVTVKDYLSESSLPVSVAEDTSTEHLAKTLQDVFISVGRLTDLGALLKLSVIQKLAPGLHKEGYEESNTQNTSGDGSREVPRRSDARNPRRPPENVPEPARPTPFNDPLAQPRRGGPLSEPIPGFDDEYDLQRPPGGGLRDGRLPAGIGHDDLYPQGLGPNDPFRPHFGGGGLPRPGAMGGGMHPTFDDPMFGGRGGQGGYDPMAPPGARYDPIGPGGAPRDNRGGRGGFPGGGGFGGGFGGPGGAPHNPFNSFGDGDFI